MRHTWVSSIFKFFFSPYIMSRTYYFTYIPNNQIPFGIQ